MKISHITILSIALLMVFQAQAQTADLSVTQTSNVTRVTVGQNVIYTLTASNAGPDANTQVQVIDELPAEVSVVSMDAACLADTLNPLLITCNVSLAANASVSLNIEVKVNTLPASGPRVYLSGTQSDGVSTGFFRSWIDSGRFDVIGASAGYMANPAGVFLQDDGGILIADRGDDLLLTAPNLEDGSIYYAHPLQALGSTVATGDLLVNPTDVIKAPNGLIYVADPVATRYDALGQLTANSLGRIISIDPMTGTQSVVAEGNLIAGPVGLFWDNGKLIVADDLQGLYSIDPNSGTQTVIASAGMGSTLQNPKAVTGINGIYYVADANVGVVKIDTNSLLETVFVATGAGVTNPIDIDIYNGTELYVLDGGANRTIQRINLTTGQSIQQHSLATDMSIVDGIDVDSGESYLLNHVNISSAGSVPDDNFLNDNNSITTPVDAATTIQLLVSENITVSDVVNVLPSLSLLINENITVSDALQITPPIQLLVSENITVSDNIIVLPNISLLVSENITVNDAVQVIPPIQLLVSENITVSDNIIVLPNISLLVSENITVSELVTANRALQLLIQELINVSDANNVVLIQPPRIVQVRPISGLCHNQLTAGDALPAAVTQLEMRFSVDMIDPTGNTSTIDVSNPTNYRLVSTADANQVLPSNCADPIGANSTDHNIGVEFYDANNKTVVLSSPLSTGLAKQRYRLMACFDGLHAEVGNSALDGNGDGVAGDDYSINFTVTADNLLKNPNFSNATNNWNTNGNVNAVTNDADNALLAGSANIDLNASISQCVALNGVNDLRFGASLLSDLSSGNSDLKIEYFDTSQCAGNLLSGKQTSANANNQNWKVFKLDSTVPTGALSAKITVSGNTAQSPMLLDRSYLITTSNTIFANGFEDLVTNACIQNPNSK